MVHWLGGSGYGTAQHSPPGKTPVDILKERFGAARSTRKNSRSGDALSANKPLGGAEGEVLDFLVQSKRNKAAALKLMRKLLKKQGVSPTVIVIVSVSCSPWHASANSLIHRIDFLF